MAEYSVSPKLDLADWSFYDSRRLLRLRFTLQNVNSMDELDAALLGMQELLCKVVVSIPDEWLVKSAPPGIEWSKPESFQYLRGDRWNDLLAMFETTLQPESASGG